MHPDINNRTAAAARLVAEPAARIAVTSDILCLCIVDIAEIPLVDKILGNFCIVRKTQHKADHQQFIVLFCRLLHLNGLFGVIGHRLFTQNMQPGI